MSNKNANEKNIKNENFNGGNDKPNNAPADNTCIKIFLSVFLNNMELNELREIEMKN